jgi:hypothetical protein
MRADQGPEATAGNGILARLLAGHGVRNVTPVVITKRGMIGWVRKARSV